ncbi:hypothetical protein [Paenibacillus sp. MMO-177]|uniref:hypothetical protein n=1 Tax=Paenibacillus sp. MMO-177 TaxID=3081289 RepID=UPI003018293F
MSENNKNLTARKKFLIGVAGVALLAVAYTLGEIEWTGKNTSPVYDQTTDKIKSITTEESPDTSESSSSSLNGSTDTNEPDQNYSFLINSYPDSDSNNVYGENWDGSYWIYLSQEEKASLISPYLKKLQNQGVTTNETEWFVEALDAFYGQWDNDENTDNEKIIDVLKLCARAGG